MNSLDQLSLAWQRVADNRISAARQEGAFDNLAGFGQPLEAIMDITDPHGWIRRAMANVREIRSEESSSETIPRDSIP